MDCMDDTGHRFGTFFFPMVSNALYSHSWPSHLVINQQIPGTHSKFITTGISDSTVCNVLYSVCFVYAGWWFGT